MENIDNMQLLDEQEAINEAMLFKKVGGRTIVDVTNVGLGRDPQALARVARATGLNIIMGTGYFLEGSHPKDMPVKTEEQLLEEIVRDVTEGAQGTCIRAGIIGEIGCTWPMTDNEKKSLRAAARAQQLTGAALNVHPGRMDNTAALEIVRLLQNCGADMSRTIISHIDVRVRDHSARCEIAKAGCYLEYDAVGWDGLAPLSLYRGSSIDIPNDAQRVYEIMDLIKEGYLNQILISQDICYKAWRVCYGGRGYAHISNYIIPLMLSKGMSQEQIDNIMVKNPKQLLTLI
jgi:phosphotriesterase-related protein